MTISAATRVALGLVAALALVVPITAAGSGGDKRNHWNKWDKYDKYDREDRTFYATDSDGNLLRFESDKPRDAWSKPITGLPGGVALRGLDFRPATGDLYALGSDRVVYRVNPRTAIAVAEGPAFDTNPPSTLTGNSFGFDFNPTVDKIRVTSDVGENLRLDPDAGNVIAVDKKLNPAPVTVVGSAYTNSSFTATRPAATVLYALDVGSKPDRLLVQSPPNDGTLVNPVSLRVDLEPEAGFDIAGDGNVGWIAGQRHDRGAELFRVDLMTGATHSYGRIHSGVTITGLAAWQDPLQ
jgi:hypothetical protein